ncbi:MAG: PPC domain-containing protein [Pirellulaceae bacterium]|nr:PPC domain-containing protein [Pirellulaceae bacterium]
MQMYKQISDRLAPIVSAFLLLGAVGNASDLPSSSYIFPAGGQRGTNVSVRIGAHYLHGGSPLRVVGSGVTASPAIEQIEKIWFEGPMVVKPLSKRAEDYPKDHAAEFFIDSNAPLGNAYWQLWTSQGATQGRRFVVGDLPEIIEEEIDGAPVPIQVKLPITINGRIFPREDVDVWRFAVVAGQCITCEVNAARLGSELDARLEVLDPDGNRIAENDDFLGPDPRVRFVAPVDGVYGLRIHDISFRGFQNYVYRLTVTSGPVVDHVFPLGGKLGAKTEFRLFGVGVDGPSCWLDLNGSPETQLQKFALPEGRSNSIPIAVGNFREIVEATSAKKQPIVVSESVVVNGWIDAAGEIDSWPLKGVAGSRILIRLDAASLGSKLDAVVRATSMNGETLIEFGSTPANFVEPRGEVQMPEEGQCMIQVRHVDSQASGTDFAYRMTVLPQPAPDFSLKLPTDALTLFRGDTAKLKVAVARVGGFQDAVQLEVEGLPDGVSLEESTIAKDKSEGELSLKAAMDARIDGKAIRIFGRPVRETSGGKGQLGQGDLAAADDGSMVRLAMLPQLPGDPSRDSVFLAVSIQTPFKIFGDQYRSDYAACGTVHYRPYRLERNGFEGPVTISLTDRQARHLQGVKGDALIVPPGETVFRYPIHIPMRLERNRIGRVVVMGVGEVIDEEGQVHKVSYSSSNVNDQIIILSSPSPTAVQVSPSYIHALSGHETVLNVSVKRGQLAAKPVTVELLVPRHFQGISARPITIDANRDTGSLKVRISSPRGPFNMPVTIRATTIDERGNPVVAECAVEVVASK